MTDTNKTRKSIHARLLAVIAASLLLALIFSGSALYIQALHDKENNLLEELAFSGELLANRTVAAFLFNDQPAVQANIDSARFIPSVIKLCAYNKSRAIVAEYIREDTVDSCNESLVSLQGEELASNSDEAWAIIPIADNDVLLGYLKIVATKRLITAKVHRSLLVVVAILGSAMLVAFWLGSRMLNYILRPLSILRNDVTRIARKPFSTHRPTKFFNDEIGDLVDAFNQMLDELYQENIALQQSEKRFRTLADNSPVGIYLKNKNNQLIYANNKWSEITGLTASAQDSDLSRFILDIDWPQYRKMMRTVIDKQLPDMVEYTYAHPRSKEPKILLEYIAPVTHTEDAQEMEGVIGSVLDVTELKHAQMELERLAFYDPLTNLPNRRFFRDHLQYQIASANKSEQSFAILMIDLDDFKRINDSMGHDAGDYLLSVIGQRLQACCFEEDVVSRLGGDEFIILLNSSSPEIIDKVSERIQKAICAPITFHSRRIETRCSIGVAIFPNDANDARDLMKNVDIALYHAKAIGRNCVVYFSSELNKALQEHITLESKLKQALHDNKLSLFLQPQIDTRTLQPVWSEALLRWYDEDEGYISPAVFIPVAEQSGLILDIGNWVFRETCRLWEQYGDQLAAEGIQGISVNLSARQFYAKDLLDNYLGVMSEFNVACENIAFEITESLVMEDIELAMQTMRNLRKKGFRLSIDDFGTGYSSLSYLKQFTIDYLKIDKSFVDGLPKDKNDMAITTAIIAMARQLEIEVVAEGIETAEQMQVLTGNNCYLMQGYLFSKPLPIEDLLKRITKRTRPSRPFSSSPQ